jgi:predicted enzyme related to lactoylglutathione lyase
MPRVDGVTFGAPCWFDLSTSDLARAKAFYGELFGWSATDTGDEFGNYNIVSKGGADLAGMAGKMPGMDDMPDAWTVYLAVEDIQAAVEKTKAAGGQVMFDAMEIGDQGSMTVIADPSGAVVGLWQPNQRKGFELNNEAGAPCWFELLARDFAAATAFYREVHGVEIGDMPGDPGDEGPAYQVILVDGEPLAGIMDAAAGILPEGVPSHWNIYLGVDDTDATVAKAGELGGSVLAPAADTPFGRFALLADPTGAAFAVISVGDA